MSSRRMRKTSVKRKTAEMGSSQSGADDTQPIDLNQLCETKVQQVSTQVEEPEEKCPVCPSPLLRFPEATGHPGPLAWCPQCPSASVFCGSCLYPCQNYGFPGATTCTNGSCHQVALLLTCQTVTDPDSRVRGCPRFRACPKCHSLVMHDRGCKYVRCSSACGHSFCFICLQDSAVCRKDKNKYWSLSCSKPKAARQRFRTEPLDHTSGRRTAF